MSVDASSRVSERECDRLLTEHSVWRLVDTLWSSLEPTLALSANNDKAPQPAFSETNNDGEAKYPLSGSSALSAARAPSPAHMLDEEDDDDGTAASLQTEFPSQFAADDLASPSSASPSVGSAGPGRDIMALADNQARRDRVSKWLRDTLRREVDTAVRAVQEIGLEDGEEDGSKRLLFAALLRLTAGQTHQACALISKAGDRRLAILAAQMGEDAALQEDLRQQVSVWKDAGIWASMDTLHRDLYLLLGGVVGIAAGQGAHALRTLQSLHPSLMSWLRCFALRLWFGAGPPSSPLSAGDPGRALQPTLQMYREAVSQLLALPPYPPYLREQALATPALWLPGQQGGAERPATDIRFELLQLYEEPRRALAALLSPLAISPSALDHSTPWHLMVLLLHYLPQTHIRESPFLSQVFLDFAAQLELLGLWHWAVYVLQATRFLPQSSSARALFANGRDRDALVLDVLTRNAPPTAAAAAAAHHAHTPARRARRPFPGAAPTPAVFSGLGGGGRASTKSQLFLSLSLPRDPLLAPNFHLLLSSSLSSAAASSVLFDDFLPLLPPPPADRATGPDGWRTGFATQRLQLEPEGAARFVLKYAQVAPELLHLAAAVRARADGFLSAEVWHLLQAGEWAEAHEVCLERLGPECVLHDQLALLLELLLPLKAHAAAVPHWQQNGYVLLQYARLKKNDPRSQPPGVLSGTQLSTQIVLFLQATHKEMRELAQLLQDRSDKQGSLESGSFAPARKFTPRGYVEDLTADQRAFLHTDGQRVPETAALVQQAAWSQVASYVMACLQAAELSLPAKQPANNIPIPTAMGDNYRFAYLNSAAERLIAQHSQSPTSHA
eukprot:g39527.t1